MLVPGESFPYRRLQDKDKNYILSLCDGPPVTNPDYLREFLAKIGRPVLGGYLHGNFFNVLAHRSIEALDGRDAEAVRIFNRGALFYAGTLHIATGIRDIPFQPEVMSRIADSNPRDLAMEAYQEAKEVESFSELLEIVRPAMGTAGNDAKRDIALAGAGLVHIATTRSMELLTDHSNPAELEGQHPELATVDALADLENDPGMSDLRQLFEGFGSGE